MQECLQWRHWSCSPTPPSWWSNRLHLPKQPVFDEGGVTRAVLSCLPFLEAQPAHTGEISENPEMLGSALP